MRYKKNQIILKKSILNNFNIKLNKLSKEIKKEERALLKLKKNFNLEEINKLNNIYEIMWKRQILLKKNLSKYKKELNNEFNIWEEELKNNIKKIENNINLIYKLQNDIILYILEKQKEAMSQNLN